MTFDIDETDDGKFSITIAKNSKVEHGPFIMSNFSTVVSIFACIYLHNLSLFF